jgi:hypothetical protein
MMIGRMICLVSVLVVVPAMGQPKPKNAKVDAKPKEFLKQNIQGWTVHISKEGTVGDRKKFTDAAIEHLSHQLHQITIALPSDAVVDLQRVPIWLGAGDTGGGIAFHPSAKWLSSRGHFPPPGVRSLIGMNNPKHYLHGAVRQPWLAYHELVHGYDFFKLGKMKGYGIDAEIYKKAMATGKYVKALHWNGTYRKPYHASNRMEFFAECSEAFFGTNDIYPFVRAELRLHDLATYQSLAKVWGVDLKQEKALDQKLVQLQAASPFITGLSGAEPARAAASKVFEPTSKYKTENVEGWSVKASLPLVASQVRHWPLMRGQLARDLHYVKRYLPPGAVAKLQKVVIWADLHNVDVPHVAYHASAKWLTSRGHNPDKAGGVEIGNPHAYRSFFSRQQSVMVRVLASAYYQKLPASDRKAVADARTRAAGMDLYKKVLRFDGQTVAHPALANDQIFFARISETLFGTSDHYPFIRYELKEKDRKTFDLLAKLWGGGPPAMRR